MKLVQYWIRRELNSFSLFRCFLVDVDEDFCDAMMNDNHLDGGVDDNVTMNVM